MRIEVTEEDIKRGKPVDGQCCPIALAVARVYRKDFHVQASGIVYGDHYKQLPHEAMDFIADFDNDKLVAPFEFDLDIEATP